MNFSMPQFSAALPEMFILSMACIILLVDVFVAERYRFVTYLLVQLTLIGAFFITLPQYREYPEPIITFGGNYIVDKLAILSKLFIYVFSFFAFAYARDYIKSRRIARSEYYLLGLFSVLGMSVMASAYSFLTIYLGLELLSLVLYAMVAMYKESDLAVEAAMKYFVLGALASGLLLYGISLLYGVTGDIQIGTVAQVLEKQQNMVPLVALIFVLGALIFKFGAVPFHMWVPDVYQGASTPTTLFIASAPKVAAFAITIRVLVQAMPSLSVTWGHVLIVIAILSMFLGNLLAIAQSNLKRMLAYSSIAHIGYTLLGILAGPYDPQGYSAAMFYISTYVLVAAGAFAIISIMSKEGIEFDKLDDYRGLNARNPWLAFMMLLLLFSMAGVPPTVGFFAKLGLLEALVQADYVWLAVLALIFALIGAYYYLRVVMLMYFEEPVDGVGSLPVIMSADMRIAISINGAAALLLGLLPSFFIDLCRISVG
ncbi:NADH-quinone oxidoreductase subunit N [Aquicella lusitana]|uniref:NADH-quinone oxidoreductase subunit N n=2 Tax=Aquicella lusitana TaxID=254246 RepID=A0A370GUK1_9COXI|nr:NADH dehydrogenase subunit N [Aquicella lusitana]VVC73807.1 NADH-quinone oxidoreductase subunit N [Aquicella lusitana]